MFSLFYLFFRLSRPFHFIDDFEYRHFGLWHGMFVLTSYWKWNEMITRCPVSPQV